MDLYAYSLMGDEGLMAYVKKHYGEITRPRGVRLMRLQKPEWSDDPTFKRLCGKDVIYIHTRCGACGRSFKNKDNNYTWYGADKWEKSNKLFLTHARNRKGDDTYCDHYFLAVVDDEYKELINRYEEAENAV